MGLMNQLFVWILKKIRIDRINCKKIVYANDFGIFSWVKQICRNSKVVAKRKRKQRKTGFSWNGSFGTLDRF